MLKKLITTALVGIGLVLALSPIVELNAQNQPVAAPVNRTDAKFAPFPNVHHNGVTNTVLTTFTNSTVKVSPGKAFTLSVTVTNLPAFGTLAITNHFDVSHDNGVTWAKNGTNGVLLVGGTFAFRATNTFFLYVANTHNYTDLRLTQTTTLNAGVTNVMLRSALVTTASP